MKITKNKIKKKIYWISESITSSMRLYNETLPPLGTGKIIGLLSIYKQETKLKKQKQKKIDYCSVPTGVALFPKEIMSFPKKWAQQHVFLSSFLYYLFPSSL